MLNFNAQAVMGEANVGRKEFFRFLVTEVMSDVGEIGAPGGCDGGYFEGFAQRKVTRVGFVAQGIDDEDRDAENLGDDVGRDVMAIAEISREFASATGKNVTVNEHFAVGNFGRDDFHAADFERCSDFVRFGADVVAE